MPPRARPRLSRPLPLVDIAPLRSLQRWYLRGNGIAVAEDGTMPDSGTMILPLGELAGLPAEEGRRTAFLGHGSLGETPVPLRDELLHTLRRNQVEAIWLVYQSNFGLHNAHCFSGAIRQQLNVYEAGLQPFQPDAPPDEEIYGHACLALRRVPRLPRRHPHPASRALRDPGHAPVTLEKVAGIIRRAVEAGTPYCARVKALGGIALDVGGMMDVWAGLETRDNQDFPDLRTVLR